MPASIESWAREFVLATDLEAKFSPSRPPERFQGAGRAPERLLRPGRPIGLASSDRSPKTPRPGALREPRARAILFSTFLHHELQAAELCLWALLAFPETPEAFRRGLVGVALDEVRHMGLYREHLEALGFRFGDFPVRDWFWERVPTVRSPIEFVCLMGMGFEGANLDHSQRFAEQFRAAGDEQGARIQERVGKEEIAHVRFAARWFREWGGRSFDDWTERLPAPLTPLLMRGPSINRSDRLRAGLSEDFVDRLATWNAAQSGS